MASGALRDDYAAADVAALPVPGALVPQAAVARRQFEAFSTIDWMQDLNKDRAMRQRLAERRRGCRGHCAYAFFAAQGWLAVTLIGALTGVFAAFIALGVELLSDLKQGVCLPQVWLGQASCCQLLSPCPYWHLWSDLAPAMDSYGAFALRYFIYVGFAIAFGGVCAVFVSKFAPYASGSGIPEVKTILGGFVIHKFLGAWTLFLKSVGLTLAVASGLQLGKEGPLVHVACCIGNLVCRVFPKYRNSEVKKREILSAASAAGVSVAFGAPIGGVLFSLEEASSYFPHKTMWRSFFAAIAGALVLQLLNPFHTNKLVLFEVRYQTKWHWFELLPFAMLGCLGGMLGAFFIRMNVRWTLLRRRTRMVRHPIVEVIIVTAITAIVSFALSLLREDSGKFIASAFAECPPDQFTELCPSSANELRDIALLLLLAGAVKLFLTVFTFGVSVPSGLFIPSLAVGAALGRAFGIGMSLLETSHGAWGLFAECSGLSSCVTPGIYALIGATSVLAGVTRVTVSLVVIVFELTGGVNLILPLMLATMCSKWVGDAFGRDSIYDEHIEINSYPYLDPKRDVAVSGEARDFMTSSGLITVPMHGNTVASLESLVNQYRFQGFPVVTSRQENVVIGFVNRIELKRFLAEQRANATVDDSSRCYFGLDSLFVQSGSFLNLRAFLDETPVHVVETTSIDQIEYMFRVLGLRYCFVVRHGRLIGVISKKDVLRFLNGEGEEAAPLPISMQRGDRTSVHDNDGL